MGHRHRSNTMDQRWKASSSNIHVLMIPNRLFEQKNNIIKLIKLCLLRRNLTFNEKWRNKNALEKHHDGKGRLFWGRKWSNDLNDLNDLVGSSRVLVEIEKTSVPANAITHQAVIVKKNTLAKTNHTAYHPHTLSRFTTIENATTYVETRWRHLDVHSNEHFP